MDVIAGKKYRHFKGHIYEVIGIAKDSETLEEMVVYQNVQNKDMWVRLLKDFTSDVDKNKYPLVKQTKRFEELND